MDTAGIAQVCHEANRVFCEQNGDLSQFPWWQAPAWQRESAVKGVEFALKGDSGPEAQHESWVADKVADGWVFGEKKDAEAKTHPCIVPYDQLPKFQQQKDALFQAIVRAIA